MDFTFNDDQLAFREAISRFLMTEAAPEMLREIWETDAGRSPDLRNKIAAQGLTALSIPEEDGGLGMDDVAWALMTQELGYYAIPDSLADTAYVAVGLLAGLPTGHAARSSLLPRIAEGSLRLAIGHPVNPRVSDAHLAEVLILCHGDQVHLLPRAAVEVCNQASIDASRRLGQVSWNPSAATLLAGGEQGRALQAQLLDRGALSVAGQSLGLAQRMLDLSVDYVAQRKQFGKPIGSFQAVKHHLADVARHIEQAKPVLYRAAHGLARGDASASLWVSQARLACCEASWIAARKGIQVHGAMGYTWEVDLQMFMKRAWALDASWGDRGFHKSRVGEYLFADGTRLGPGHTFED
ncbi:acyl-CoA dehydrogenase family protein [Pseudomonas sp. 148P]|uniref:Acyl-CoA dehydrogenase family protein n=1 Tax=Pseudomonas ulcerans TaxID=3115852 RepID=A0ABU7I170_9PSED|nr:MULTISPECIES: acyl-CoA dehydrogenase family protein [unclassified Pseudomonas]MEE1926475.1 acyl-CoA dehydrogenase family protein [Pseudomonas sp. 147P]MEE1937366.1 acyl-CoA dehydrogenase family protein [Pseudomonas sp. 148P]